MKNATGSRAQGSDVVRGAKLFTGGCLGLGLLFIVLCVAMVFAVAMCDSITEPYEEIERQAADTTEQAAQSPASSR